MSKQKKKKVEWSLAPVNVALGGTDDIEVD